MDHGSFDRLTRLLGSAGSRRAALSALAGAGLAGTLGIAEAAKNKKHRSKKRKGSKKSKGGAGVSAQAADCLSPGPSSNMSGCDYDGSDFSGENLSSSRMVGTTFRNAELAGANLSSSNLKGANFRGADLRCADLSSSQLRNADFRGFAGPGNETNLFGADLSSSGCAGVLFNSQTRFCGTITCNGTVRNDDCGGLQPPLCRQPREGCTADNQCLEDGPTECGTVIGCALPNPVCCRQTGGSCSFSCDCCGVLSCNGGSCS